MGGGGWLGRDGQTCRGEGKEPGMSLPSTGALEPDNEFPIGLFCVEINLCTGNELVVQGLVAVADGTGMETHVNPLISSWGRLQMVDT